MLATLIQATSVTDAVVVASAFTMEGRTGGQFVSEPTNVAISTFAMHGNAQVNFVSELFAFRPAAFVMAGVADAVFDGVTIQTGHAESVFQMAGHGATVFHGEDAQIPPTPIPVRFVTGPDIAVIPVEVVDFLAEDVIVVTVDETGDNYTAMKIDPLHPDRKRIRIV